MSARPATATEADRPEVIISSNGRYLPISATRKDYDGAPDSRSPCGTGYTVAAAVADLIEQEHDHAGLDCQEVTVEILGAGRTLAVYFDYAPPEPSVNYAGYFDVCRVLWGGVDITVNLSDDDKDALKEAIGDQQREAAEREAL